jgi:hypothetical protein
MELILKKDYNRMTISFPLSDDATVYDVVAAAFTIIEAAGYDRKQILQASEAVEP